MASWRHRPTPSSGNVLSCPNVLCLLLRHSWSCTLDIDCARCGMGDRSYAAGKSCNSTKRLRMRLRCLRLLLLLLLLLLLMLLPSWRLVDCRSTFCLHSPLPHDVVKVLLSDLGSLDLRIFARWCRQIAAHAEVKKLRSTSDVV